MFTRSLHLSERHPSEGEKESEREREGGNILSLSVGSAIGGDETV